MLPWIELARAEAPDGQPLVLRRRGRSYLIVAAGHDLMSSEDEGSSRELASLGCAHLSPAATARVLVGGLGMGFTLRAALDATGPRVTVEVAELIPEVVDWNRGELGALAGRPLDDPRTALIVGDVRAPIRAGRGRYDAILLDVDNGPDALAHAANEALYGHRGLTEISSALRPGGILGVWSFSDDPHFTARLERAGFAAEVHRVQGSRKGRGRYHFIWIARRPPAGDVSRARGPRRPRRR